VLGDERASPLTQRAGVELLIGTLDRMREYGLDVDRAVEILRTAQENPEQLKSYAQSMFDLQAEKMEEEIRKLQAETELQLKRIGLTEAQIEKIKQETINSVRRLQQIDQQLRIAQARLALDRAKFEADLTFRSPAELREHLNTLVRLRGRAVEEVINHIKLRYPGMRTDTLVDANGNPLPATQVRSIFERSGFTWTSDLETMWRNAIRMEQQINKTIADVENKYRQELERSF
jgi:vacuolar-type H+-ATPase subunit I/STV1